MQSELFVAFSPKPLVFTSKTRNVISFSFKEDVKLNEEAWKEMTSQASQYKQLLSLKIGDSVLFLTPDCPYELFAEFLKKKQSSKIMPDGPWKMAHEES